MGFQLKQTQGVLPLERTKKKREGRVAEELPCLKVMLIWK